MQKPRLVATVAFLAAVLTGVSAQQESSAQPFTTMAASSDILEIRSGEVALQNVQSVASGENPTLRVRALKTAAALQMRLEHARRVDQGL